MKIAPKDMKPGMVFVLGPRHEGKGFAYDNGTGTTFRLIRPLGPSDWYVTDDWTSPLEEADWTHIVHVSRLSESEFQEGSK